MLGWALSGAREAASGDDLAGVEIARRLLDPLTLTGDDTADPIGDLRGLYDALFEDLDFELLYDLELDGVEIGRQLGVKSLGPASWFIPYDNIEHLGQRAADDRYLTPSASD